MRLRFERAAQLFIWQATCGAYVSHDWSVEGKSLTILVESVFECACLYCGVRQIRRLLRSRRFVKVM